MNTNLAYDEYIRLQEQLSKFTALADEGGFDAWVYKAAVEHNEKRKNELRYGLRRRRAVLRDRADRKC